jgi:hypothetical protein
MRQPTGRCLGGSGRLIAISSYLTFNPHQAVSYEGIDLALEPHSEPRAATLLAVRPDRVVVRPGEQVGVEVTLAPFRGSPVRRRLDVQLPADLAPGKYSLLVGDGASVDGARLEIEPVIPGSLDQALAVLGGLASRCELALLGRPGRGVAAPGRPSHGCGTVQPLRRRRTHRRSSAAPRGDAAPEPGADLPLIAWRASFAECAARALSRAEQP